MSSSNSTNDAVGEWDHLSPGLKTQSSNFDLNGKLVIFGRVSYKSGNNIDKWVWQSQFEMGAFSNMKIEWSCRIKKTSVFFNKIPEKVGWREGSRSKKKEEFCTIRTFVSVNYEILSKTKEEVKENRRRAQLYYFFRSHLKNSLYRTKCSGIFSTHGVVNTNHQKCRGRNYSMKYGLIARRVSFDAASARMYQHDGEILGTDGVLNVFEWESHLCVTLMKHVLIREEIAKTSF